MILDFHNGLWERAVTPTIYETFSSPHGMAEFVSTNIVLGIGCIRDPIFDENREFGIHGIPGKLLTVRTNNS